MAGYVLDTSALMRLFLGESEAEEVQEIVEGDEPVALPFMTLMELRYVLLRQLPRPQVDRILTTLRAWPVDIPESDPRWGEAAAEVKAKGGLSLADAWNAALALLRDYELVHKDPEFDGVSGLRAIHLGTRSRAR